MIIKISRQEYIEFLANKCFCNNFSDRKIKEIREKIEKLRAFDIKAKILSIGKRIRNFFVSYTKEFVEAFQYFHLY